MQGQKPFLAKVVTRFRLSERVPPHNIYRRLAERVDGVNVPIKRANGQ
jgi:hypothetical protein